MNNIKIMYITKTIGKGMALYNAKFKDNHTENSPPFYAQN
jgi:hypothetical protein